MLMMDGWPSGFGSNVALLRPVGASHGDEAVAAQAAAPEVVHLKIARGFVEAKVVEEVVEQVADEEEMRLGRVGRAEGRLEVPAVRLRRPDGSFDIWCAPEHMDVVPVEYPRVAEDRRRIAKRSRQAPSGVIRDRRAAARCIAWT